MSIAARRQARRNPAVPAPPWRARPHRHRGVAGGGRRGGGAALVAVCAALWLCAGCGDDAFDLGKTSATSGSGAGGAGGGSVAVSSGSGAGGAGGSPIVEPPGATTFTLVQGIVDRPSLRFCLIPYPAGPHDEQPWPGVGGLSFGSAHVETDISQLISDGSDMQLWGIAGDLTATGAKNCATLLQQTPANVTTWSFGVLPASVFQQDKDLLLVTNGCLGGDGHTDEQQTSYCGAGYSPQTPNATVTAGFMSRLMTTGKISLQFVHATQAAVPMRLRVRAGNDTAVALTVEKNWGWGSYAPYPPFATFSDLSIGNGGDARIQLTSVNGGQPVADTLFSDALSLGGVDSNSVSNGRGVVFVAIGAAPPQIGGSWWQGFAFTAVKANPAGR